MMSTEFILHSMKMKLKGKIFLFSLICFLTSEVLAGKEHLHGEGKVLIKITRKRDNAEFKGDLDFIERTFMHPLVKDRKIVVFSIIGSYRDGKSFFLDYCLRYLYANYGSVNTNETKIPDENWMGSPTEPLSGFSWEHGTTAETKGLMMWSDVFLYNAPNGEKIAIIVVDTQGLFESHSPEEENAKIFSLSTLISSIQVINIKERVQENQIAHLQTAIELTKLIMLNQPRQSSSNKKPFQNLIFLLRDFEDSKFNFGFEGGQKYFESFFRVDVNPNSKSNVNRNSIKNSFDKISCFLLNYPGRIVKSSDFFGDWGRLEEPFVRNLKSLIESLLYPAHLVKKSVLGQEITAENFKTVLKVYLSSYSNYSMPQVDSIFKAAVEIQMGTIVNEELKRYKEKMINDQIDFDREDFDDWLQRKHNVTKNHSIISFISAEKIKDQPSEEKFKQRLEEEIENFFMDWKKSTLDAYTAFRVEKGMQAIVNEKSNTYRKKINENVDYEIENFIESIETKHKTLKNSIIREFTTNTQKYNDDVRTQKYCKLLLKEIDGIYKTWKESVINHYRENKIKSLVDSGIQVFRQQLENDCDFNQNNFANCIKTNYEQLRTELVNEFETNANELNDSSTAAKFKTIFGIEMDNHYASWSMIKLRDYNRFMVTHKQQILTNLTAEVQHHLLEYQKGMNEKFNLSETNYLQLIEEKHKTLKLELVQRFESLEKDLNADLVNEYSYKLESQIEEIFLTWKDQKIKEYQEYNQYQQQIIDKEMVIRIQMFTNKYETLITENLSFDIEDFEAKFDTKNQHVTSTILNEFSLDAASSNIKYLNDLKARLKDIYLTLRQKKMVEHKNAQELKQVVMDLKADNKITQKIHEYRSAMALNIDYNQNDFDHYYKMKHENVIKNIVKSFLDEPEIASNPMSGLKEKALKDELESVYNISKTKEQKNYQINMEQRENATDTALKLQVTSQLAAYEKEFLTGINYEVENFEIEINKRYENCQRNAVNRFDEAANLLKNQIKKNLFQTKLIENIKKSFNDWKVGALQVYDRIHREKNLSKKLEMENIANDKLTSFKQNLRNTLFSSTDYEKFNFGFVVQNTYEAAKENEIREFKKETKNFSDITEQKRLSDELENNMSKYYSTWRNEVMQSKMNYENNEIFAVETKMKAFVEKWFQSFKKELNEKSDPGDSGFLNTIESIGKIAEENAVSGYESDTIDIKSQESISKYLQNLRNKIQIDFNSHKIIAKNDYTLLRTTGKWIPYDHKTTFPRNTVVGGYYDGSACAVARFNNFGGEFCLAQTEATINVNYKPQFAKTFEILLHSNFEWVYRYKDKTDLITNNEEILCRDLNKFSDARHVGRNVGDYCVLVHNRTSDYFRYDWEYLVKKT